MVDSFFSLFFGLCPVDNDLILLSECKDCEKYRDVYMDTDDPVLECGYNISNGIVRRIKFKRIEELPSSSG